MKHGKERRAAANGADRLTISRLTTHDSLRTDGIVAAGVEPCVELGDRAGVAACVAVSDRVSTPSLGTASSAFRQLFLPLVMPCTGGVPAVSQQ